MGDRLMESSIRSADRPLTCPSVLSPEGSHNMLSKRQQNGGGGNRTRVLFPPLFEGDQVSWDPNRRICQTGRLQGLRIDSATVQAHVEWASFEGGTKARSLRRPGLHHFQAPTQGGSFPRDSHDEPPGVSRSANPVDGQMKTFDVVQRSRGRQRPLA